MNIWDIAQNIDIWLGQGPLRWLISFFYDFVPSEGYKLNVMVRYFRVHGCCAACSWIEIEEIIVSPNTSFFLLQIISVYLQFQKEKKNAIFIENQNSCSYILLIFLVALFSIHWLCVYCKRKHHCCYKTAFAVHHTAAGTILNDIKWNFEFVYKWTCRE